MITDAFVEVVCDSRLCSTVEKISLQAGARSTYLYSDERIEEELRREGWTVVNDLHFCSMCALEKGEDDELPDSL